MEAHPLVSYTNRTGRTTTEIAKAAGCSRMTLYRLIKGEQNATVELLQRVSKATNGEVPVEALLPAQGAAA